MAVQVVASPAAGLPAGERRSSLWGRVRGIAPKLYAGFAVPLLLMAGLGYLALRNASHVTDIGREIYGDPVVSLRLLSDMRSQLGTIDSHILRAIADPRGARSGVYRSAADQMRVSIDGLLSQYAQANVHDPVERRLMQKYRADWDQYRSAYRQVLDHAAARGGAPARVYFATAAPLYGRVDADLARMVQYNQTVASQLNAEIKSVGDSVRRTTIGLLLLALLVSALIGFFIARGVSRTAKQVAEAARNMAAGQVNQRIEVTSNDELGDMADAFRAMISNIREVVGELQRGSSELAGAGAEIVAAATQQASGATEQSAAIAETTATVDEVKASADQATQMAQVVTDTAREAARVAGDGVTAVGNAVAGMADIRERVQSIAENILALSEQSQQIGEIIATVNDLADQSNLLALNAAIEASRAGEHGRGFTVVAQEIRTLAEQSKAATAQVRTILSDIQRATNAAVLATEQGTKGVDAGSTLIEQAGKTIDEMADVIGETEQVAGQIAASVRQHSVGMEQIAAAMGNINQATTQNLAATSNMRQAAENLTELAGRLNRLAGQYQL